ncbi:MAG: tyrosine-type recombinase/integrase [Lachnospiraceae bacterium]|jgi:integrase/recombinase XerD|nr:tyrosine-type recombinase/integrase [Lachnospiraceae bacterium]
MKRRMITNRKLAEFGQYLREEEYGKATMEKYLREVGYFCRWLENRKVDKKITAEFKNDLQEKGYAPSTINGKLSALNAFFRFAGWEECRVKFLRIQRQIFREQKKELNREEYRRLLKAAKDRKNERLALLMETICGTGIRISEMSYITVEALRRGRAEVVLKGKVRIIFLSEKLCRRLSEYAEKTGIVSGEIFLTGNGRRLSRRQIWREMKGLCQYAGLEEAKVFPHNLRHLFAEEFYRVSGDIVKLADVLGHSSIETTRIYLKTSGKEHTRYLDNMGLLM